MYQRFNSNKLTSFSPNVKSTVPSMTIVLSGRLSNTKCGTTRLICWRIELVTDKSSQFKSHGLVVWSHRLHKESAILTDEREITVSVCMPTSVSLSAAIKL